MYKWYDILCHTLQTHESLLRVNRRVGPSDCGLAGNEIEDLPAEKRVFYLVPCIRFVGSLLALLLRLHNDQIQLVFDLTTYINIHTEIR